MKQVGRCATILVAIGSCYWAPAVANPKEDAANRKIVHAYAKCVVGHRHDRAAHVILADEGNGAILNDYRDLISEECMGSAGGSISMSFGGDLYRYALADALVNADFSASGPADFSDKLPLAHFLMPDKQAFDEKLANTKKNCKREELIKQYQKDVSTAWLSHYGECVARKDPVGVRLWLLTPPEGPEEISRINALRPAFSSCLDGGTMTFTRIVMRGTVALNYYRLAMATPVLSVRKAN